MISGLLETTFAPVKKILSAFFVFLSPFVHANEVSIRILDAENRQPVNGAIVLVSHLPGTKTTAYLPDYDGKVKLPLFVDNAAITVKCLGFNDYVINESQLASSSEILLKRNNINLNEVAITAAYTAAPTDQSAFNVKVIDKAEMEKMAAVNVADVMNKQLNGKVSYDQAFGSVLNLQGMDMKNVKVLIDGVPVIGRLDGNIDLTELNLSDVDRMEIIEGPMSTVFGTDAIGGVINLVTKSGFTKKSTSTASAYYESIGNYNVDAQTQFKVKSAGIKLSVGRNFFDGQKLSDSLRVMLWKPKTQYFGSLMLSQTFKHLKLSYKLSLFDEKISDKGPLQITEKDAYAYDTYYKVIRGSGVLAGDYFLNGLNKVTTHVAYSGYQRRKKVFRKDMETLQQGELSGTDYQDTTSFQAWNIRSTYNHVNEIKNINYQAGIDFNLEQGAGKRIKSDAKATNDYAVFASAEYKPLKNILIRPGLRYAYNTQFNAPLTPSINVKYNIGSKHVVRASYSRGFRAPGVKELYLDFNDNGPHNIQGNTDLRAETSNNYQLGYGFSSRAGKINYKTDVKFFYNDVNNLITLAQVYTDSTLNRYINIGKFKSQGVEWTHTVKWNNLGAGAGIAYTGTTSDLNDVTNKLNYFTQANANVDYTFKKVNLTLACFYKYNGEVPFYIVDDAGNKTTVKSEAYSLMDVSATKKLWKNKIALSTGIKNVFDVNSIKQYSGSSAHESSDGNTQIMPGRSWFAKLTITL